MSLALQFHSLHFQHRRLSRQAASATGGYSKRQSGMHHKAHSSIGHTKAHEFDVDLHTACHRGMFIRAALMVMSVDMQQRAKPVG